MNKPMPAEEKSDCTGRRFRRIAHALITGLFVVSLVAFPAVALADAGGFSGGSDYGGGGFSSGGGSDYGSSWDSDSGNSYYYGSSDSSSSDEDLTAGDIVMGVAIFAVLIGLFIAYSVIKKKGSGSEAQPAGAQITSDERLKDLSELAAQDPEFNSAKVEEKVANLYVQMQNAWTAKDLEPMRPYMTGELYGQFDRQLDVLRKAKRTNRVDDIAVLDVALRGYYEQDDNECLVARVRTRIKDYTVDDATGDVVSGDADRELFMEYEYTLVRTKGTRTGGQAGEVAMVHCPNCGAPIDLAQSAKCEYCGGVVTAKDYGWVISIIKGVSQQSGS